MHLPFSFSKGYLKKGIYRKYFFCRVSIEFIETLWERARNSKLRENNFSFLARSSCVSITLQKLKKWLSFLNYYYFFYVP